MDNDKKVKELWYMPAIRMFANVSGWIAGPIIIALFVGKWLDRKYDSSPWFFIGLTVIAFIISIAGIMKILMKYLNDIEKEAKEKRKGITKD